MNADILKGKWKQIQGEAKKWWGDLTDDELTRVDGEQDKLVGLLQEKYGYSKEKAEAEIGQRLTDYERSAR
jgi:uncharacterized protein YjbJ (UPF0337 family)